MEPRSVRLFLADGTPQGLRTAQVGNWSGLALLCPRTDLVRLGKRDPVHGPGVYFLIGPSEQLSSRLMVYVGEADDVWVRLQNHAGKEFWTSVIVFVSKDENLTKAHVRWLEAQLVREIRDAKRADVENEVDPGGCRLPEADTADMNVFLDNIRLLLPTLGADVLRTADHGGRGDRDLLLELKWEDAQAECRVRDGQFIVTKRSTARVKEVDSLGDGYRNLRRELREKQVLAETGNGLLQFTVDYPFNSPTAAAAVVTGTGLNGRAHWKVKGQGISYKEWQEQQVAGSTEPE